MAAYDEVLTISDIIEEMENPFDDGQTIEYKATEALSDLPRTVAIEVIAQLDHGSKLFVRILKGFMVNKPFGYVITGDDMHDLIAEFRRAVVVQSKIN